MKFHSRVFITGSKAKIIFEKYGEPNVVFEKTFYGPNAIAALIVFIDTWQSSKSRLGEDGEEKD